MGLIDMRSTFLIMVIINAFCTLLLSFLWTQDRFKYSGISYWVGDFFFLTIGQLLIAFQGLISDGLSIGLGNTMVISAAMFGYVGLARFLNEKPNHTYNIALLVIFIPLYSYFTFAAPSVGIRYLISSAFLLIIYIRCLNLMIFKAESSTTSFSKPLMTVYSLLAFVSSMRVVKYFIGMNQTQEYFESGTFELLALLSMMVLFIILTYSIGLTLNKRLIEDLERQEKKYARIFSSSPNSIIISRLEDGEILEVNNGFTNMFNHQNEDAIGASTQSLYLWGEEGERERFINEMKDSGKVRNLEMKFRKKNGQIMDGIISADILDIDDEEFIVSVTNDMSIFREMENKIKEAANMDTLTNTFNRKYVLSKLEEMLKEYKESGEGFSISIIDIDSLKKVSDTYGYQAGDAVLVELAKTIKSSIRDEDFVGRFGGEEFIIVSPGSYKTKTVDIMNSMLNLVRSRAVKYKSRKIAYTFSAGVADCFEFSKGHLIVDTLIKEASDRLHNAKENGKNQIKF